MVQNVMTQWLEKKGKSAPQITFTALDAVASSTLLAHMRDPRIARHLPLLMPHWDEAAVARFLTDKAAKRACDGLGHWAIWIGGNYAGWGGFQKEGEDWDYGLVLRPEFFSHGMAITRAACTWLVRNTAIREASVLLPLSRSSRALVRIGARRLGEVDHEGFRFTRWALPVLMLANSADAMATCEGSLEC